MQKISSHSCRSSASNSKAKNMGVDIDILKIGCWGQQSTYQQSTIFYSKEFLNTWPFDIFWGVEGWG